MFAIYGRNIQGIRIDENLIIRGDLNDNIGRNNDKDRTAPCECRVIVGIVLEMEKKIRS